MSYCGSDPFGPIDKHQPDITPCFQSLIGLVPPALMLLAAVIQVARTKCNKQSINVSVDESITHLPRFPQLVCVLLSLTDCLLIFFALIQHMKLLYLLLWPALDFVAWLSAVAIVRMDHQSLEQTKHQSIAPRIFFFLSLLVTAKYAESAILLLVSGSAVTPLDIVHFCRVALCIIMLRYVITGIGRASDESFAESWTAPLTRSINHSSINQDVEEGRVVVSSTPTKTDKSMWNRFLSIGDQQQSENDDDEDQSYDPEDQSNQSNRSASQSHNPFASSFSEQNPFLEDIAAENTNPFSLNDQTNNPTKKSKSRSVVSSLSAVDEAINQTSAHTKLPSPHSINHPLKNAIVTIASIQTSQLAGRSVIQYQVRTKLDHQSINQATGIPDSSDEDLTTLVNWKRYREFEGLHDSITVTAKKCQVSAPILPNQPRSINQSHNQSEEVQREFETYCNAIIAQPLFRDDFAAFIGLDEKLVAIKQFIEVQKINQANKSNSNSVRSTPRLAAISESQQLPSINQSMHSSQPPARSTAPRQSINHTTTESVSAAGGWPIIAISVVGFSRWNSPSGPASKHPVYMTYDIKVTTNQTINQTYIIHKKPSEVLQLRASMSKYLNDVKQSSKLSSLLPHAHIKSEFKIDNIDLDAFNTAAANVDIFLQTLINATAFQIPPLLTFLALQSSNQAVKQSETLLPHEQGTKPIDSYDRIKKLWNYQLDNNHSNIVSTNQSAQPNGTPVKQPRSDTVTINIDGTPRTRGRHSRNASITQPNGDQLSSQPAGESRRRRAARDSSLFPELAQPPPLESNESNNEPSDGGEVDAAHRFQVFIPSFEQADPTDSKSPVMYTIIIREFFSLTSFIEWQVVRRYRDFDRMHRVLHSMFADYEFPALPGKSSLRMKGGSKKGDAKLEARRAQLELYIQKIINVRAFQVDEFFAFFDLNNANRVFTVHTVTAATQ